MFSRRTIVMIVVSWLILFGVARCSNAYADGVEYSGFSYGFAHTSDPIAGKPFNTDPEATTDAIGIGPYFTFKHGTEFHLWFGVKRDRLTSVGKAYSLSATILVMRRHPRRKPVLMFPSQIRSPQ